MKALHTIDVIVLFSLQTLNRFYTLVDFEHVHAAWDVNANYKKINWRSSSNFASNNM